RPAIAILKKLQDGLPALDNQGVQSLIEDFPAGLAKRLLNVIISDYPEEHPSHENALMIAKALLSREDVRNEAVQSLSRYSGWQFDKESNPLTSALMSANVPMTILLAQNGAVMDNPTILEDLTGGALFYQNPI